MWALCRRDHGLTWGEFCDLTLAQLEALEERRAIDVRHGRFNAALIASAIINVNRSEDSPSVSPFDFLVGFETDPEDDAAQKLRRSIKQAIGVAFAQMKGKTAEEVQAEKAAMVVRMRSSGVGDPEELIREVFPDL